MKAQLNKSGFDRNPHNIDKNHWFYEDRGGIQVYEEGHEPNAYICTVPWRSIKASYKRYLASKEEKKDDK